MSLLLDAIRKLEGEKKNDAIEASAALLPPASPGEKRVGKRRGVLLLLAALAILLAAGAGYWVWSKDPLAPFVLSSVMPRPISQPMPHDPAGEPDVVKTETALPTQNAVPSAAPPATPAPPTAAGIVEPNLPEPVTKKPGAQAPALAAAVVGASGKRQAATRESSSSPAMTETPAPTPTPATAAFTQAPPSQKTPVGNPSVTDVGADSEAQRKIVIEQRLATTVEEAWQASRQGDLLRAREGYRAVLALDANDVRALTGLASLEARQGHVGNAARLFEQALAIDARDADALAGLAALRLSADPLGWESRLRLALTRKEDHPGLWAALGAALVRQQRWSEAAAAFLRASVLDPGNPDYVYNQAIALEQAGRGEEAAKAYRSAVALAEKAPAGFDTKAALERAKMIGASHE